MTAAHLVRRHVRSWRDRFNPNRPMVFTRRLVIGAKSAHTVLPGDELTPELAKELGLRRLKIWWDARFLASKDYVVALGLNAPKEEPKAAVAAAPETEEPLPPNVKMVRNNVFDVTLPDGKIMSVQGRAKALRVAKRQN